MNKVYLHQRLAKDTYLGRIDEDGRVYESRLGPDKYVGRVEPDGGKIYESRLGPDKYIGRVDPDNGKVYLAKLGPDEYLGKVTPEGKLYLHKSLASDEYIGQVTDMVSLTHGGAAFLLLVRPAYDESKADAKAENEEKTAPDADDAAAGEAAAPA